MGFCLFFFSKKLTSAHRKNYQRGHKNFSTQKTVVCSSSSFHIICGCYLLVSDHKHALLLTLFSIQKYILRYIYIYISYSGSGSSSVCLQEGAAAAAGGEAAVARFGLSGTLVTGVREGDGVSRESRQQRVGGGGG